MTTEEALKRAAGLIQDYLDAPSPVKLPGLHEAIELCENLLKVYTEEATPMRWAITLNSLAIACYVMPAEHQGEILERAISYFEKSLRFFNEHDFPEDWAATVSNLANVYRHLPTNDHTENLKRAISYYQDALRVFTEQTSPREWAGTMNNLAGAWSELRTGDRVANLKEAICCYQEALRVLKKHAFPVKWAMIMNNLANAWSELRTDDWPEHLKRAIAYYKEALRVRTEQALPVQWALTMANLATAYRNFPLGDREKNLKRAIAYYKAALRVRTEQAFPKEWASTIDDLAVAYSELSSGDRGENLKRSISYYEAALRIRTEQAFPLQWATTMNNLGEAYFNLPTGNRAEHLNRAAYYYEAALRIRTPEQLPFDCLQTLGNLINVYFDQDKKALDVYLRTIETIEQIRGMALSEPERRRIFEGCQVAFDRAILCAVRTGQYDLALCITERGKSRNLADHLWRREIKPHGVLEEEWRIYQRYLMDAREIERGLSVPQWDRSGEGRFSMRQTLDQLRALRREIAECEGRFRKADPNYLPFAPPLEVKEINALAAAADAVLVVFRVTEEGSFLFLIGPEEKEITPDQVMRIDEFGDEALGRMLIETENGGAAGGWLVKYELFRTGQLSSWEWLACVEETTRALYERLLAPLHQRLQARYPEARRLILIPNKGLNLLPLHAGWWEENGERRALLDEYEISYAPSCQVLKRCLSREPADGASAANLFAVQNPDGTLHFPDWEVEEVSKCFGEEHQLILRGSEATEEAVKERMAFGEEKLFSCHGLFDLNDVEQSRLELHGGGNLSVRDIVPIDLKGTWLVVMSACETGLTDHRDLIDEYQGLPAAFLVAGAATVVGSLWAVDDFCTALLMKRFHQNLYEGKMAKAPALRGAQRWLRELTMDEVAEILETDGRLKEAAVAVYRKRNPISEGWDFQVYLKALAEGAWQGRPFANPYWWGAFQCVGAGWPSLS